jgi:hypothetical protein
VKGLVVCADWDIVHEVWTRETGDPPGKIWKYLPRDIIKSKRKNHAGVVAYIELKNGSELFFDTVKSFLSNPLGSESKDWDFNHYDEPAPEQMFKANARGLMDRSGSVWFTLTAISEPWIWDYCKAEGWTYTGSTYENPYLTEAAIAKFESTLTDRERQCRLYGKPLHFAGLVYKVFDRERHVLKHPPYGWVDFTHPPLSYTLYVRIDPHPETPHGVIFCAVAPNGVRYYFADLFEKVLVNELCTSIRNITKGYTVISAKIDPAAYIRDPVTGRSMAGEFNDCGVCVIKASKDLSGGILKVEKELAKDNPQMVYFCPTAERTLYEIERYCWDPDKPNKPIDKDDHLMECLYRCEVDSPQWYDPETEESAVSDIEIPSTPSLSFKQEFGSILEQDYSGIERNAEIAY